MTARRVLLPLAGLFVLAAIVLLLLGLRGVNTALIWGSVFASLIAAALAVITASSRNRLTG